MSALNSIDIQIPEIFFYLVSESAEGLLYGKIGWHQLAYFRSVCSLDNALPIFLICDTNKTPIFTERKSMLSIHNEIFKSLSWGTCCPLDTFLFVAILISRNLQFFNYNFYWNMKCKFCSSILCRGNQNKQNEDLPKVFNSFPIRLLPSIHQLYWTYCCNLNYTIYRT